MIRHINILAVSEYRKKKKKKKKMSIVVYTCKNNDVMILARWNDLITGISKVRRRRERERKKKKGMV